MGFYASGGDYLGAAAGPDRAILIRLKGAGDLAKREAKGVQGGIVKILEPLAPKFIESQVYTEMAKQLAEGFRQKKVDADVQVVESSAGWRPPAGGNFWLTVAAGSLAAVLGGGVLYALLGRRPVPAPRRAAAGVPG